MIIAAVNLMNDAGKMAQGGLAVVGAAVLGAVVMSFCGNLASRFVVGRPLPVTLVRFIRVLGGVATGLAVGWFVFSGTGGLGLGGGFGPGDAGKGISAAESSKLASEQGTQAAEPMKLGITMLGEGRVKGAAFYLVDGNPTAWTLAELQIRLQNPQLPAGETPRMTIRLYEDSVAENHPAITQLRTWAEQNKWQVVIETHTGVAPGGGS